MSKYLLVLVFIWFLTTPLFAQSADTAWVRRYNGTGNSQDAAYAIAVDGSGNVYVTGYSMDSLDYYYDYATIKYDPAGNQLWVQRYNGPGNSDDWAHSIAVDGSGNVYVTGSSVGSGTGYDYATIKYDSLGNQLWVARYNGPANSNDWASAMTVDDYSNVYVTGTVAQVSWQPYYSDFATVKYYPGGDTAWARIYNGPGNTFDSATAIVVDKSGDVYVTGASYGSGTDYDYVTIKYQPDGDTVWVRRYNGPANKYDRPEAIAVDSLGDVYVTGYSMGNGTYYDWATVKYDSNGAIDWVRRYTESGNYDDRAYAMVLDDSGNIYVAGTSYALGTSYDCVIIKYLPNGDTAWTRRYDGPEHGNDEAKSIVVDDSDNIYVAGSSEGIGTYRDYVTIKYHPNGNRSWVSRYNGSGNDNDYANAIAVDHSGNVYVTGYSVGTSEDYATIKYIQFLRGDANGDGKVTVSDVLYLINYLFKGGPAPAPVQAGDVNCDGKVTVADVIYLINYLFKGGPPPAC